MVSIMQRKLLDSRLVGVSADMSIWNANRYPHGALLHVTLADHLQDPDLAAAAIAVAAIAAMECPVKRIAPSMPGT